MLCRTIVGSRRSANNSPVSRENHPQCATHKQNVGQAGVFRHFVLPLAARKVGLDKEPTTLPAHTQQHSEGEAHGDEGDDA